MALVTGAWTLKDLNSGRVGDQKNGLKVWSCFHCGGGSTMGYKLAGFDVLGGIEIDPQMMNIYRRNHSPREDLSMLMPVQDFKAISDSFIPEELRNLDILDGSPPCSSFSLAGSRDDAWGEKKKFREGQANQILDDLFFHFIDVADRLRPKVVIAENVKGLIVGSARGYVRQIFAAFRKAGYETQLFLLNSSRMGVPQARERTFFIARRIDLNLPKIVLDFNEEPLTAAAAIEDLVDDGTSKKITDRALSLYCKTLPGTSFGKNNKGSWFNHQRLHPRRPAPTLTATCCMYHYNHPRQITESEAVMLQSFPTDYDFMGVDARYVCGMSVPPLMMQRVAAAVRDDMLGWKPSRLRPKAGATK